MMILLGTTSVLVSVIGVLWLFFLCDSLLLVSPAGERVGGLVVGYQEAFLRTFSARCQGCLRQRSRQFSRCLTLDSSLGLYW